MLTKLLPSHGYYCLAVFKTQKSVPRHRWFLSVNDLLENARAACEDGLTVYVAQASYKNTIERTQQNVEAVKSFWLDIDCGEGKPFSDQATGIEALDLFCGKAGLPLPAVVGSGNGLYAHWFLTDDITEAQWKATATLLYAAGVHFSFDIDTKRTADSASILRFPGMLNFKDPENPKPVVLLRDTDPVSYAGFHAILSNLPLPTSIIAPVPAVRKTAATPISQIDFGFGSVPVSAHIIAEKCNQIRRVRDLRGDVSEPLWHSAVCLLRFTEEAPEVIYEWSDGHPDYSVAATDKKIFNAEKSGTGPIKCATFQKDNPDGCVGCSHNGKITSPIQLGRNPTPVEIDDETLVAPRPFRRTKQGLFVTNGDVELRFYPYDLFVSGICFDESLGYEVLSIEHYLPNEGWMTFMVRSALVNDPKMLMMCLWDNHIKVTGKAERNYMTAYIEGFAEQLQRQRRITQLMCQMGWKETRQGRAFVLGKKIFYEDGHEEDAALARNIPHAAEAFHAAGELAPWVEATKIFDQPGMEPYAFAFCAAAFGAPLMKFTGYSGALVSMVGPSGVGKTLVGQWALSAYGEPDRLMMLKDDTKNALIGRLGVYGNLPLYIDEVTNISGEELSDFVYRITQGREKARSTRTGVERAVINHWNTLAIVSSNTPLIDKLFTMKSDANAEINRIFQFEVMQTACLDRDTATGIYRMFHSNYGNVGVAYVKALISDLDGHVAAIDRVVSRLDAKTSALGEERFWSAVAGVAIYGGALAKRLGLVNFDVSRLTAWCIDTIQNMRIDKKQLELDAVSIIGRFIDEHISGRLVVKAHPQRKNEMLVIIAPRGPLVLRLELDTGRLYLGQSAVREWLNKRHLSFNRIRDELLTYGALLDVGHRRVLGANTEYAGAQQPTMVLNMHNARMGQVYLALASDPAAAKKAEKLEDKLCDA